MTKSSRTLRERVYLESYYGYLYRDPIHETYLLWSDGQDRLHHLFAAIIRPLREEIDDDLAN